MFKSSYDNSTHYSREDGLCTQHGVVVALPEGKWHAILSTGVGQATEATIHDTRWAAERKLEGFHTINDGVFEMSRDDISTTWRDKRGSIVAQAKESWDSAFWEIETLLHCGAKLAVSLTHSQPDREAAETWVSRNF